MMAHTEIPCDVRVTLLYPPCMACIWDVSKATLWTLLENRKAGAASGARLFAEVNFLTDCWTM